MSLKFRLKGLAETFIEDIRCPCCRHDGGDDGDQGFRTELTRVTFEGIIVVIFCEVCSHVFVPAGQRFGIINPQKLRLAVEKDSRNTGQPLYAGLREVQLEVERLNAEREEGVH